MQTLLQKTAERASRYYDELDQRGIAPTPEALEKLKAFDEAFPEHSTAPAEVLAMLDEYGSGATYATVGGRYFGFVVGGALPASVAANWLAGAWDEPASYVLSSPVGVEVERIALGWMLDALALPSEAGAGFVTGATMANFSGLAAARHAILKKSGWDVETQGLFGAPPITVVVGDEVHASVLKALTLIGFGRERVIRVPVDSQGRMRADAMPELTPTTLVCIQAGNVNTGAFDPARAICEQARAAGAWVHVDGAFGLWARATSEYAHLADGLELADSWATDGHKWLNVPYDSGIIFCRDEENLRAAMTVTASYLKTGDQREPCHYTPEFSRRARGFEVWAALKSLGRAGLADMIERNCQHAKQFAEGLTSAGYEVLNDVVLNQVLVKFGDAETTNKVIAGIQEDGTCWCGGTVWQGHTAMRISVSSWATTEDDVARSLEAMIRVAREVVG